VIVAPAAADVIPWWGWIAIWGGLVLALVAMLVLFAWWLFRKAMVVLDDLADLGDVTSALDDVDDTPPRRARPAVLDDLATVRAAREARVARRDVRRSDRRDRRMARARRITSVDASTTRWPEDWYPGAD
jgi:hypothetical protein